MAVFSFIQSICYWMESRYQVDYCLSSKSCIMLFNKTDDRLFARDEIGQEETFTDFKPLKNRSKPTKILFNEQFLSCATVLFPTLSPCITELSVLFYILLTEHSITSKSMLSIDNAGAIFLMLPKTGFTVKKTNLMKKKNKILNFERSHRLRELQKLPCSNLDSFLKYPGVTAQQILKMKFINTLCVLVSSLNKDIASHKMYPKSGNLKLQNQLYALSGTKILTKIKCSQ